MRTITRFLRRFLILLIVFVMGVAGTAFLMNNETTDDRSDMNNPTLPEVMVDFNGTLANRISPADGSRFCPRQCNTAGYNKETYDRR